MVGLAGIRDYNGPRKSAIFRSNLGQPGNVGEEVCCCVRSARPDCGLCAGRCAERRRADGLRRGRPWRVFHSDRADKNFTAPLFGGLETGRADLNYSTALTESAEIGLAGVGVPEIRLAASYEHLIAHFDKGSITGTLNSGPGIPSATGTLSATRAELNGLGFDTGLLDSDRASQQLTFTIRFRSSSLRSPLCFGPTWGWDWVLLGSLIPTRRLL